MKMSRYRWLRPCLTLLAIAGLAGCGDRPQATVRFWAMGREAEVVGQLLPDFERENPDIRVEVQNIPWTAAHEKLLTAFAADALPDLCQLGNTWVPEFATLGALEPLDARVEASAARAARVSASAAGMSARPSSSVKSVPTISPTRYGSSPKLSSVRPQRGSRARSAFGAQRISTLRPLFWE